MSKVVVMNSVKNALNLNRISGEKRKYEDLIKHNFDDPLKEYMALQEANKATLIESSNLIEDLRNLLVSIKAKKALYTLDLRALGIDFESLNDVCSIKAYDKSVDEIRNELFDIDTSIIYSKCAIADIGIFGLASSPEHPRLASLLTTNCIVILPKKNIAPNISEGLKILRGDSALPSNMLFIAGASRTADIELKTVFGVHGPQQVYIVLV